MTPRRVEPFYHRTVRSLQSMALHLQAEKGGHCPLSPTIPGPRGGNDRCSPFCQIENVSTPTLVPQALQAPLNGNQGSYHSTEYHSLKQLVLAIIQCLSITFLKVTLSHINTYNTNIRNQFKGISTNYLLH